MKISSPQTRVNLPVDKIFKMASNCQNFVHYMTDHVKDVCATEDSCTFTIENMAKVTLKILEKKPDSSIRFVAENDKNIPFFLDLNFNVISENETDVEAHLDMDIPLILTPMLQKPLQHFMETLSEKLKNYTETIGS